MSGPRRMRQYSASRASRRRQHDPVSSSGGGGGELFVSRSPILEIFISGMQILFPALVLFLLGLTGVTSIAAASMWIILPPALAMSLVSFVTNGPTYEPIIDFVMSGLSFALTLITVTSIAAFLMSAGIVLSEAALMIALAVGVVASTYRLLQFKGDHWIRDTLMLAVAAPICALGIALTAGTLAYNWYSFFVLGAYVNIARVLLPKVEISKHRKLRSLVNLSDGFLKCLTLHALSFIAIAGFGINGFIYTGAALLLGSTGAFAFETAKFGNYYDGLRENLLIGGVVSGVVVALTALLTLIDLSATALLLLSVGIAACAAVGFFVYHGIAASFSSSASEMDTKYRGGRGGRGGGGTDHYVFDPVDDNLSGPTPVPPPVAPYGTFTLEGGDHTGRTFTAGYDARKVPAVQGGFTAPQPLDMGAGSAHRPEF